jgi:hypothetical protein
MRPGLSTKLLVFLRRRASVVARQSSLPFDDVGWLVSPDDPDFAAMQAERRADANPTVAGLAADLDRDIARLQAGWRPESADLVRAPTILVCGLHFSMSIDPSDQSFGVQFRGPVFDAEGSQISQGRITSLAVAFDAANGTWARTPNRFYRLANNDEDIGGHDDDQADIQGEPS